MYSTCARHCSKGWVFTNSFNDRIGKIIIPTLERKQSSTVKWWGPDGSPSCLTLEPTHLGTLPYYISLHAISIYLWLPLQCIP